MSTPTPKKRLAEGLFVNSSLVIWIAIMPFFTPIRPDPTVHTNTRPSDQYRPDAAILASVAYSTSSRRSFTLFEKFGQVGGRFPDGELGEGVGREYWRRR